MMSRPWILLCFFFFFSSRRRHTRSYGDWSSDVCSSDLLLLGPGQIDRRGNRCALRVRRDCGAKGTHQRSRVLLQGLAADVCSRVTGAMIAGIVRATGFPAEQLRFAFRLLRACARIKTDGRNALLGERGVVGSKPTADALFEGQVVRSEIGNEFISNNRSYSLRRCARAANETGEIGRADHVEIDINRDLPALLLRQGGDVVARADQATFLCAPECKAHASPSRL